MASLFTVPVSTGGSFVCSSAAKNVYLLSFTSPPDNRVTPAFLTSYLLALDILERRYPRGVLITTSGIGKFFSNGFNLTDLVETPKFFENYLLPVLRRLLTYSMPTISLINGHTFGAGVFISIACDYQIMNPSRGFWCLPEVDLGVAIPSTIVVLLKAKISKPIYRDAVFEGRRYSGPDALKAGLVDGLGGLEEVLKFIDERKLIVKAASGVIGSLKEDLWREVLAAFADHQGNVDFRDNIEADKIKFEQAMEQRVSEWEKKSKL